LEREPEGWTDLLADFSVMERVAYSPKRPLAKSSPWSWDAVSGILDCRAEGIHEFLLYPKPQGDVVVHVEWRYVGQPLKPNSGLFLRVSDDASNWLQAHMSTAGLGSLAVKAMVDGVPRSFGAGKKRPELQRPDGDWNVMEVICRGPEIALWINGETVATMPDCPLPVGRLGLEAEFDHVQFRNLKMRPLPAQPTS
jgi:hypothetical protein